MELNSARNVLQESGAMKVALIATYPEMSRILQSPTIHSWTHSSVRKEFLLRTTG